MLVFMCTLAGGAHADARSALAEGGACREKICVHGPVLLSHRPGVGHPCFKPWIVANPIYTAATATALLLYSRIAEVVGTK